MDMPQTELVYKWLVQWSFIVSWFIVVVLKANFNLISKNNSFIKIST